MSSKQHNRNLTQGGKRLHPRGLLTQQVWDKETKTWVIVPRAEVSAG